MIRICAKLDILYVLARFEKGCRFMEGSIDLFYCSCFVKHCLLDKLTSNLLYTETYYIVRCLITELEIYCFHSYNLVHY